MYQAAGAVLTRLEEKKDSTLKAACLQSPFKGKKMLTALVSQTVRYGAVIEALLEVRKRQTQGRTTTATHTKRARARTLLNQATQWTDELWSRVVVPACCSRAL